MSTEDGSNKNNIDGNGTDKNSIDKEKTQEFLHKNGRYLIMAGMLVVILIGIVMLVNNKGTSSADPKARAEKVLKEDYQVDENEAVTKLMKNYYKYYAEGNVDKDASRRVEVKFRLKDEEMIQELNKIMQGDSAESDSTAQKKEKNQKENQDNKQ